MSTLTSPFEKSITYDRATKDFRAELNGDLVGFFGSYHDAEVEINRVAYELASDPPNEPNPLGDSEGDSCDEEYRLIAPTLYCTICMCVVDHVDATEWLCRNERCLARYADTTQLLTQSELLKRRAIIINIAMGICPSCGGEHSIQACSEITQAVSAAPIKRIALGKALCRIKHHDHRSFVMLLSSLPVAQLGIYAESYVAYIQSHTRASDLTKEHVLKVWAKLLGDDGRPAPAMRLAA